MFKITLRCLNFTCINIYVTELNYCHTRTYIGVYNQMFNIRINLFWTSLDTVFEIHTVSVILSLETHACLKSPTQMFEFLAQSQIEQSSKKSFVGTQKETARKKCESLQGENGE
jgi:hypothetical protein